MAEVARGLVDADGRLVEAEDALLRLAVRAGGGIGRAVSVPQLAAVARLARRLQVPISRNVLVADPEAEVDLFVQARPEADAVRLSVVGWREREPWRPAGDRIALDLLRAGAEWRWECDAGLRLGFVSVDAGARHGFEADALLGRPLTDLFAFGPDAEGGMPIMAALAERRSFDRQPASVLASGSAVLLSAAALRDGAGAFAGFAGAVEHATAPSTDDPAPSIVAGAADRLGAALRAPLERIVAGAEAIRAGRDGPIGSGYADYAADIAGAGRHLLSLVDDLADLDALERPDFRPDVEAIDLADLARRAAGLLSVRAADLGVAIAAPAPDQRTPARGDSQRVLQILVNLIGNAVRYSPRGAVVTVSVAPGASVTVADRGRGVADRDRERIFGKFERVDPLEPGGGGLGLYIARRLARAMGGGLTVESAPGEGARFTLSLPPDASGDEDQH